MSTREHWKRWMRWSSLVLLLAVFIPAQIDSWQPSVANALENGLVTHPPMGWNSWNKFACTGINETVVRQTADALVSSGLAAAGYVNLTIDDCWSAQTRDSSGNLQPNLSRFPSGMKAVGDYIHSKGLKYGLYASIGTETCTGHQPGSLDNEFKDVRLFASWGVDYIKADRCGATGLNIPVIFARWRDAIAASGRPIILSASDNGGVMDPWSWGPSVAHQWRTTGDIRDNWLRMLSMLDGNSRHAGATVPQGYNDPDMLEVGNGGMTDTEYRAHFGMWALMSAPLIAGNDVRNMSAATKAILTSPEVIAMDHDPLAFQAIKASDNGAGLQVWYKPLQASGARAVGLLNRSEATATMSVSWTQIGLLAGNATVRDLYARADRGTFNNSYSVSVPAHGIALLRVVGQDRLPVTGFLSDQNWTYAANELGAVERNRSFNTAAGGDGNTITLNGTTYSKGLGVHAPSAIEFRPNGTCSNFTADIGLDDEVGSAGNVIFQVWADGTKLYDSGVMTGASATKNINLDITGRTELRLQVAGGIDTSASDHADWANARITCGTTPPNRFEAENATISQGLAESNHAGFSGSGFVNYDNVAGSFVEWTVNAAQAGNTTLTIGFANGTTTNRPMEIRVNGTVVNPNLAFNPTGAWSSWATQSLNAALTAGNNTIRATATTANGGPNVDYLDLSQAPPPATSYEAEAGTLSGAARLASCAACSGGQKVGFIGNGAANFVTINNLNVSSSGNYTLRIDYLVNGTRSFAVSVNGGAPIMASCTGTSFSTVASTSITVPLNAGNNTIKFGNDSAYAPDLDRIVVQ